MAVVCATAFVSTMIKPFKPTPDQIRAAYGKTVRDVIAPRLRILFCGINPGLYTAAVGHHFARPGNRFWPTLCRAGFTNRLLSPFEERELLDRGFGITNVVARATASAEEISKEELREGARILQRKARRYRPRMIAVLGMGAYRGAFERPEAALGRQAQSMAGATVWVLPNPSGLNAHYQVKDLVRMFVELRVEAERS